MDTTLDNLQVLNESFYNRDTSLVAKELLGKILIRRIEGQYLGGFIVETEAYYGDTDPASHAFRGKTPRSKIMFGRAGIAYVYFCYGMYNLLNAVTEKQDIPGAVLIRALEPVYGIEIMKEMRKTEITKKLTNGPGKLTISLGIDLKDNGKDLTSDAGGLYIAKTNFPVKYKKIGHSQRVGINSGKEKFLRYFFEKCDFVST
ncbi:MAG: DNA-3-methyladenine glycosylase [Actinobacteria bacterium]|nr:DNA-3-methyladenine glycosylase [Actinomycetota bacterium]